LNCIISEKDEEVIQRIEKELVNQKIFNEYDETIRDWVSSVVAIQLGCTIKNVVFTSTPSAEILEGWDKEVIEVKVDFERLVKEINLERIPMYEII